LTPSCPFFTWTANGPACGEQCADLLAVYGDEDSEQKIDLGGGIALVRHQPMRRPRRGPTASDRPFDARQIALSDEHRPHADRRTVALIGELNSLISLPPSHWTDPGERSYDIRATREQLEVRGFGVEALIRYGIGGMLPVSITAHILLPIMMEDEHLRPMIESNRSVKLEVDADWQKYFESAYVADTGNVDADRSDKLHYATHGFLDRLRTWLEYADLEDIVMWNVPLINMDINRDDEAELSVADTKKTALWAIERFTKSYVPDWTLSSLHLEWLYLHGRRPGPCSPTAMAERRTNVAEVDAAIASDTTDEWLRRRGSKEVDSSASDFIAVAAGHLRNGKPELAAAIFEALTHIDQSDAYALNNYGFCLLILDASAALQALDRANKLFEGQDLTNLANRVLALHLLGRNDEAYALGISEESRNLPSHSGLMWLISQDDELELSDWIDVRAYLKTLMTHIDTCCGGSILGTVLHLGEG
jgi:hypothetical protein